MDLRKQKHTINDIPDVHYLTRRDGFCQTNKRFETREYCKDYNFCHVNPGTNYLESFERDDDKHNKYATLITEQQMPPVSPSTDLVRMGLPKTRHKKLTSVTPLQLLPRWTDHGRRNYVDHFYAINQLNRAKYLNDSAPTLEALEYFKIDDPTFGSDFFSICPRPVPILQPSAVPVHSARATRDITGKYVYTYGRSEGP